MIYEFCAENVTLLEKAMKAGARRVELCDNLAVGGTTPSFGVIKAGVELGEIYDTTMMTMIRPRGGDFVYSSLEVEIMIEDISKAREAGSQGVVFGALTPDNELDTETLERLLEVSKGLEIVFHMAFDNIPEAHQLAAIDWLASHGVRRILTRAGDTNTPLEVRFARYRDFLNYAEGRIEILPGGGIDMSNREIFLDALGVNQLHGTKVVF